MFRKLLIVDDNQEMLKLLSILIKKNTPCEAVTTADPVEALELTRQGGFDIVITDLKMPALDGIELLDAVAHVDEDIPVIIITAYGSVETALEAMGRGAFDFIRKPFRKEQMLSAVNGALDWIKLRKENRALKERLKLLTPVGNTC